jgi:hypothetical protein
MASIDVDPFTTANHARRPRLAGALLGYASVLGLALTLWGTLISEAWHADEVMMAGVERSPVALVTAHRAR